jgi:hypothetical protein
MLTKWIEQWCNINSICLKLVGYGMSEGFKRLNLMKNVLDRWNRLIFL